MNHIESLMLLLFPTFKVSLANSSHDSISEEQSLCYWQHQRCPLYEKLVSESHSQPIKTWHFGVTAEPSFIPKRQFLMFWETWSVIIWRAGIETPKSTCLTGNSFKDWSFELWESFFTMGPFELLRCCEWHYERMAPALWFIRHQFRLKCTFASLLLVWKHSISGKVRKWFCISLFTFREFILHLLVAKISGQGSCATPG